MTELILIRHGQANTGATDEASYDNLSDQGRQQARYLGDYLRATGGFDRVISGAMKRQIQTAEELNHDARPHTTDARLNELDYFGLSHWAEATHNVAFPNSADSFAAQIPQVLDVWRHQPVADDLESYDAFRTRIFAALQDAAKDGPAVLVTSTGVIATLTAIALHLETNAKSKMFLTVQNTSVHKFELREDELHLTQFGATPHLDLPERHKLKSHY